MAKDNFVSLSVRKGIWDAFSEIASQREVDTLEIIEEVLIDFIVNNVDDCHRFPDLLNDDEMIKSRPTC
ncbi:MAG: hypothetical protein SV375_22915 [Thermodesulfobacteriota bacterium]|jgi:hypothetical protein|nr:hypothetical protein [Thermodesulfobacteriota bacterium]